MIDANAIRELALKVHEFESKASNADALFAAAQFGVIAATGFPIIAGMVLETNEQKGVQVVIPDYRVLSGVTEDDMREVEKRFVEIYGWGTASITRGQFQKRMFRATAFRISLTYKVE